MSCCHNFTTVVIAIPMTSSTYHSLYCCTLQTAGHVYPEYTMFQSTYVLHESWRKCWEWGKSVNRYLTLRQEDWRISCGMRTKQRQRKANKDCDSVIQLGLGQNSNYHSRYAFGPHTRVRISVPHVVAHGNTGVSYNFILYWTTCQPKCSLAPGYWEL